MIERVLVGVKSLQNMPNEELEELCYQDINYVIKEIW